MSLTQTRYIPPFKGPSSSLKSSEKPVTIYRATWFQTQHPIQIVITQNLCSIVSPNMAVLWSRHPAFTGSYYDTYRAQGIHKKRGFSLSLLSTQMSSSHTPKWCAENKFTLRVLPVTTAETCVPYLSQYVRSWCYPLVTQKKGPMRAILVHCWR